MLSFTARAQGSEDPSDATPALAANVTDNLSLGAFPASCPNLSASFSLASVSSVTAESIVPYAPCTYAPSPSPPAAPPNDMWFRLNPAFSDAVYRFTLVGSGATPMTRGGLALYEAPSAAGPFRLLACATGGGGSAMLASAEATCLTAGNKVYVRVWDRTVPAVNSSFSICVTGQRSSTLTGTNDRGADETACTARTVASVGAFSSSGAAVNYVYSCDEGFLQASGEQAGGDLWVKLVVPPTGWVVIKTSNGTSTSTRFGGATAVSGILGTSAYLATNCNDKTTFREVGFSQDLVSAAAGTGGNLNIRCLPPGATLYVRFYSLKSSMNGLQVKRFGQFRFEWMAPLPYVGWTPADMAANGSPCGAASVVMNAAAANSTTVNGCNPPNIPPPYCGSFSNAKLSVWHSFVAPPSGMVQIDVKGVAPLPIPAATALYTSNGQGCDGNLALVACDDRQGPGGSARIIKWGLTPGQTYYVRTWSTSGADGTFSIQVTEPTAAPGNCMYMVDLWQNGTAGSLSMSVSINGGPPTVYSGSPSGGFLVQVPQGASVDFAFSNTGTSGMYYYAIWQAGWLDPLWWSDGGYAVYGPQPIPTFNYHLTSACTRPASYPIADCAGMKTICPDMGGTGPSPTYTWNGSMRVGSPINDHNMNGVGSAPYQGYTYSQGNGYAQDLAGANFGCLEPNNAAINWLVLRPTGNGTVGLMFQATTAAVPTDLDFAIWDMGALTYDPGADSVHADIVCPPQTAPIRCSSARTTGYTGMLAGRAETTEGHGGYGFVAPLPVQAGHGYLIALVPVGIAPSATVSYTGSWTLYRNAGGTTDPSFIICNRLVLPVELLFLAGLPNGNQVDLTWATATEKNSSRFVVERSTNNLDFTPIGQVRAAGNSQYRIDYGFTDPAPVHGVNYYRLRLVDLDGSYETSNVIAVEFTGTGSGLSVWPNPVQELLHIGVDLHGQAAVAVQVLDAQGRVVQQQRTVGAAGQASVDVGTATLVPGAYMVRILGSGGEQLGTARFVKD